MTLGSHADFIIAAYTVAAVIVGVMIVWIVVDYRAQMKILADFEARGVTRRSERTNGESSAPETA